jgi:hypothetical protein
VPFSSSQKRDRIEYCRSRQPSLVATEITRVAGMEASTGGAGRVLASTGGATGTETEGSVCCWVQRSKQASRASLLLPSAAHCCQVSWASASGLRGLSTACACAGAAKRPGASSRPAASVVRKWNAFISLGSVPSFSE